MTCWLPPNLPRVSLEAGACRPSEGGVLGEHELPWAPPPWKKLPPLSCFSSDRLRSPLQTAKLGAQDRIQQGQDFEFFQSNLLFCTQGNS